MLAHWLRATERNLFDWGRNLLDWLVIFGLAIWVWWQGRRIGDLKRRVADLEGHAITPVPAAAPAPMRTPIVTSEPPPAPVAANAPEPEPEPLLLDRPLPPEEPLLLDRPVPPDEPLLLDTPLPPVSNDEVPGWTPPLPRPRQSARRFEKWFAENGLAWIGGGALALGAISLVAIASQQSWFNTQVRLGLALALGVVLIGVSEWARRIGRTRPPGHPLVAALLAGAGAATFYAVAWASHGLYHFVDWPAAAALLTLCALILLALSFLHGQPLGVLAIIAALLAPAFASATIWPSAALTLYVCSVGVAGFALGWLRRWAWATAVTMLGLYFWFAAAIAADDVWRALALLSFATLGGLATQRRMPLVDDTTSRLNWERTHALMPTIAVCISSSLLIWTWLAIVPAPNTPIDGPAVIALAHVVIAALAVRNRMISPPALAIAIGGLVFGFIVYLRARAHFAPLDSHFFVWILFAPTVIALCALGARPHREGRVLVAGAGAIGAAMLYLLAAFSRSIWESPQVWWPLFLGGALLFFCALLAARDAQKPEKDWAIDLWTGASAALAMVGVESLLPPVARAVGYAGISAAFALAFAWRGWRASRVAALTAAVLALAHALSPDLIDATVSGVVDLWRAMLLLGATTALLFAAARLARRDKTASEALNSAAVLTILIALFLGLRFYAAGNLHSHLEPFTEQALRVITLMAAGLIVMPRSAAALGWIGAWRGHVLMAIGLIYALVMPSFLTNPWWGWSPAGIPGPPIFDSLALAFAAPAALALYAASRLYDGKRMLARIYASAGGVLALEWAILEIRHIFAGRNMAMAPIGLMEGALYALLYLSAALGVALAARMRIAKDPARPFAKDLGHITNGAAWAAILIGGSLLLLGRHPWWGDQNGAATHTLETAFAVLAQAAALAVTLFLGRALSRGPGVDVTRFGAASAAVLFAWSFGHAALRWLYHFGAMDDGAPNAGIEGFAQALWPLVFVSGGAYLTARAPGRDTVRAYLYDLQAIWAAAIWPALVFTALSLWLFFPSWWGFFPIDVRSAFAAVLGIGLVLLAAWLSLVAPRVPHVRWPRVLRPVALVACTGHLLLAITLVVRWSFHHADLNATLSAQGLELWTYSGVFAVFGGGMVALGASRNDATLSRIGLIVLMLAFVKVGTVDVARLSSLLQATSWVGLGAIGLLIAWTTRRIGQSPRATEAITADAPRETPRDPQQS